MMKGRFAVAFGVRQGDPQLGELKSARLVAGRVLGVRDAAARSHQVDLAGMDPLPVAEAVRVQDPALDHPAERLQPDVRVRADREAAARRVVRGPGVVEEAPGADHAAMPVRQRAPDFEAFTDGCALRFEPFQRSCADHATAGRD